MKLDIYKDLLKIDDKDHVENLLKTINARERFIVMLRVGFDDKPYTFKLIAEELGISIERVRQIYFRALKKMQHWINLNES